MTMKLGIMQPYVFPYIGYYQLVAAVDKFVCYDDVAYIKQGWINRNNILLNGNKMIFTIPLKNASSFTTIANTEVNEQLYDPWKDKFFKTLSHAYMKAPYYKPVSELIASVLDTEEKSIGNIAAQSLVATSNYIGIDTAFKLTATDYGNNELRQKDRVIDICKKERADVYINPIGGMELYTKDDFTKEGIELYFVKTRNISYKQFNNEFVPWLSVIDVMMFNSPQEIKSMLKEYDLV